MKKKQRNRDAMRKNEWRQKQYRKDGIVMMPTLKEEWQAVMQYLRNNKEAVKDV